MAPFGYFGNTSGRNVDGGKASGYRLTNQGEPRQEAERPLAQAAR